MHEYRKKPNSNMTKRRVQVYLGDRLHNLLETRAQNLGIKYAQAARLFILRGMGAVDEYDSIKRARRGKFQRKPTENELVFLAKLYNSERNHSRAALVSAKSIRAAMVRLRFADSFWSSVTADHISLISKQSAKYPSFDIIEFNGLDRESFEI